MLQDALLTVLQYPFVLDDPTDVPLEECWLARPLLDFTCYLTPRDRRSPTGRRTYGEDDIQVHLMFYSTFQVLELPGSGPTETRRVVKLYKPFSTPILYVGTVSNLLGRVPFIPLFSGFSAETPRRPSRTHCFRNLQRSKLQYGCAKLARESGRKESNVYEVKQ